MGGGWHMQRKERGGGSSNAAAGAAAASRTRVQRSCHLTLTPCASLSLPACALSGNWAIFKTSAIKGDGLFEGLDWLVATLREGK